MSSNTTGKTPEGKAKMRDETGKKRLPTPGMKHRGETGSEQNRIETGSKPRGGRVETGRNGSGKKSDWNRIETKSSRVETGGTDRKKIGLKADQNLKEVTWKNRKNIESKQEGN